MKNTFGSLSDDDVRQIALLVQALDHSSFDFLQLDVADLKLILGKGVPLAPQPATFSPPAATAVDRSPAPALPISAPAAVAPPPPAAAAARTTSRPADGVVEITAPIMGLFYSKPNPGSPPFVAVGAAVSKDSTVGLIEVMKVFNSVPAGVDGVITEICVPDAEAVVVGQALFRVRPTGAAI